MQKLTVYDKWKAKEIIQVVKVHLDPVIDIIYFSLFIDSKDVLAG